MPEKRTVAVCSSAARPAPLLFGSLVETAPQRRAVRRGATLFASAGLHSLLLAAVVALPLLLAERLPAPAVGTFFAPPLEIATLPPPPAPAGNGGRVRPARRPAAQPSAFAPVEIPTDITTEDLLARELGLGNGPGVDGGVETDDGLTRPPDLPAPPEPQPTARPVQIGGRIAAPRLVRRVAPIYPELAVASRVPAIVILEAEVDPRGHVKRVSVLRGHPLFDDAAIEAVRQWRYQPLLLNGEPTAFILTVTVNFNLQLR